MEAEAEREEFRRAVVERAVGGILRAAEERAERLRAEGLLDAFEQARLEGFRRLAPEIQDCDLRFIADAAHGFGLSVDFALLPREGGDEGGRT